MRHSADHRDQSSTSRMLYEVRARPRVLRTVDLNAADEDELSLTKAVVHDAQELRSHTSHESSVLSETRARGRHAMRCANLILDQLIGDVGDSLEWLWVRIHLVDVLRDAMAQP